MEKFQRVFDVFETIEIVVNEVLQFDIQMGNLYIEFYVVSIEFVILVVK
jgi:hypothetical protein